MKICRITLPRDVEQLEQAIRDGMDGTGIELAFEVGDVGAATVRDCLIPQNESATEGGMEVGTAALIDFVQGKITRIEQAWREESRSRNLLCDIQQELANAIDSLGGKRGRSALDNYYFHAAKHLNRAAEGFIFLRKSGRMDASKFLVRPVIETIFRVEAVRKKPELLYRIAYSESIVEDRKWIRPAAVRAGAIFDEAAHLKRFEAFKAQLNEQFPNLTLEDKYISLR